MNNSAATKLRSNSGESIVGDTGNDDHSVIGSGDGLSGAVVTSGQGKSKSRKRRHSIYQQPESAGVT